MSDQNKSLPDGERVSEENARRVLERAIQIDAAHAGDTTVGELRRVAEELNISSTALMQALQEVHAPTPALPATPVTEVKTRSWVGRAVLWARIAGVTLAGMIAGQMVQPNQDDAFVIALLSVMAGAMALTLYERSRKPARSAVLDVAMLFTGFLYGWGRTPNDVPFDNDGKIWFFLISGVVSLAATVLLQRTDWPFRRTEPKQEFTATA